VAGGARTRRGRIGIRTGSRTGVPLAFALLLLASCLGASRPPEAESPAERAPAGPTPATAMRPQPPPPATPVSLLAACREGGDYLVRHQHADGRFDYIYDAATDQVGSGYNILRHAGACYALAELYQATKDRRYLDASRRGIDALLETARPPRAEHRGAKFEAVASDGEAKLGGSALAVLAILKWQEASGASPWTERARHLGSFLLFQQEANGRFRSTYLVEGGDERDFESRYYPGEAVLALARLARVDRDPKWLRAAERGAAWIVDVRDAKATEPPPDQWLVMSLDELHRATGKRTYADASLRIADAIVRAQRTEPEAGDLLGSFAPSARSTPASVRGEALVAACAVARRLKTSDAPYFAALERLWGFLRRCQITGEAAASLPRPAAASGGFRSSLEDWKVRIDFVQHAVSALLGYSALLSSPSPPPRRGR
jgi:hypothetical protein